MQNAPVPAKSIVIFDDDEDILSVCTSILKMRGWVVHTFTDCYNVVEKVMKINSTVILMDNWLPGEGGIHATKLLKTTESLHKIPVIFFTANSDIELLAKEAGADTWLAKPFNLTELEQKIDSL